MKIQARRCRCFSPRAPRPAPRAPGHGFTFVELMIVSVLLVILGGAFVTTFLSGQTSYFAADANIQIQQEARRAFDVMTRELRQSGTTYTGANKLTCNGTITPCTAGGPYPRIDFQIARSYSAGAIEWGSDRGPSPTGVNEFIHYRLLPGSGTEYKLVRFSGPTANDAGPATVSACTAAASCRILANYILLGTGATQSGFLVSGSVITIQLQLQYRSSSRFTGPTQTMGSSTAPLVAQVELRNP